MSDNNDAYWAGYQTGLSGGAMPTYESIRDNHGQAAANFAYSGNNDARGNSSSGK